MQFQQLNLGFSQRKGQFQQMLEIVMMISTNISIKLRQDQAHILRFLM